MSIIGLEKRKDLNGRGKFVKFSGFQHGHMAWKALQNITLKGARVSIGFIGMPELASENGQRQPILVEMVPNPSVGAK